MKRWRELGYVPDSEDEGILEDEDIETQSTPHDDPTPRNDADLIEHDHEDADAAEATQSADAAKTAQPYHAPQIVRARPEEGSQDGGIRDEEIAEQLGRNAIELDELQLESTPFRISSVTKFTSSPHRDRIAQGGGNESRASSLLTSLPDWPSRPASQNEKSDDGLPTLPFTSSMVRPQHQKHSRPAPSTERPVVPESDLQAAWELQGRPERSLRKRNPIQLHPYLLEMEKYKQTLKARGVKPVRIEQAQEETQVSEASSGEAEESQEKRPAPATNRGHRRTKSFSSAQPNSAVRPVRIPRPPPSQPPSSPPGYRSGTDDLPDINELFRSSGEAVALGNKRRKTKHVYRSGNVGRRLGVDGPTHRVPVDEDVDMFDVPPSPPRPHAVSRISSPGHGMGFQARRGHRRPGSLQMPTIGDSELRSLPQGDTLPAPPRMTAVEIGPNLPDDEPQTPAFPPSDGLSLNDTPLGPTARRVLNTSSSLRHSKPSPVVISDSSSASEPESEDPGEVQLVRRRIKGVLPASWLKLDLKAQGQNPDPKPARPSKPDDREAHQTGVARRVQSRLTPQRNPRFDPLSIDMSDDSEPPTDTAFTPTVSRPKSRHSVEIQSVSSRGFRRARAGESSGSEAMEDNRVDRMGQSHRNPAQRKPKKRQPRITDVFSKPKGQPSATNYRSTGSGIGAPRDTGAGASRSVARRKKPPKLGILDAVEADPPSPRSMPAFLKIAVRQARRMPDEGRHRPVNKHIRLQTRQDTQDANATLQRWREGTIPKRVRKTPRSDVHPPRTQASSKQQQLLPQPVNASVTTKSSSKSQLQRKRQTLLNVVSTPAAEARNMPPPKARQPKPRVRNLFRGVQPAWRDAQLEVVETGTASRHGTSAFAQGLRQVEREYRLHSDEFRNPQLARYLQQEVEFEQHPGPTLEGNEAQNAPAPKRVAKPKPRKRPARRVDVETQEYRQPIEFNPPPADVIDIDMIDDGPEVLAGLGSFGMLYSIDFDVLPLPLGTYFHDSTFVGSGEYRNCLTMARDLDLDAGSHVAALSDLTCTWTSWNDEMATTVQHVFHNSAAHLESLGPPVGGFTDFTRPTQAIRAATLLLRKVIKLNSSWLSFSDPIDRSSCVATFLGSLEPMSVAALQLLNSCHGSDLILLGPVLHLCSLLVSLLAQLTGISQHETADSGIRTRLEQFLSVFTNSVQRFLIRNSLKSLRTFLDDNRRHSVREAGIREEQATVEAVVVLWHALQKGTQAPQTFWKGFNEETQPSVSHLHHVAGFEQVWYDIFTVLPFLEMDDGGLLEVGKRFSQSWDNWDVVKALVSRVLTLYSATSTQPGSTINNYIRATLARCHHLIQAWGWRKCDSIIGTIFDFFARNGLAPLRNENLSGSPRFLENLEQDPQLNVVSEDKSFHIFLKIIALGLKGMQGLCPDKAVRSLVWRCIPNHGRTYPKDKELKQHDLDALRNHHDLLCTLYWASPPAFRPRLQLIRNLVDHATSHREACRLNVRAWTILVRFQLSTDEPVSALEPFAEWFSDIVQQTIYQYRLARTEAESQYEAAIEESREAFSLDVLTITIGQNQAQVLGTLIDAVSGMKAAIGASKELNPVVELVRKSGISQVAAVFDVKTAKSCGLMQELLLVFEALLGGLEASRQKAAALVSNEESQDYGEWPEFDLEEVPKAAPSQSLLQFILEPLSQLLSNCFGAELPPEDSLLTSVVDTWARLACLMVKQGEKEWNSFLDSYGSSSWSQLGDTPQKRKYGPYFLSALVKYDSSALTSNHAQFISAWLVSLVERDSMLKFQHHLTSVLLNADGENCLLRNLPFAKTAKSTRYGISAAELRERRLSLISSVLENMREHYDLVSATEPSALPDLRRMYTSHLKSLMTAVKRNYLGLQNADPTKSAYTTFAQSLVSYIQQYTSDITPVDLFFTDSAAFPLPVHDPAYVVGRLKSYSTKLSEPRAVKQLAAFIQNLSERAALDSQQDNLVVQFNDAIGQTMETGDADKPTLRSVLLQTVFPPYIGLALKSATGWILATPVLHAMAHQMDNLRFSFMVMLPASVAVAQRLLAATLASLEAATELLVIHAGLFDQVHVLHILRLVLVVVRNAMYPLDYIMRRVGLNEDGKRALRALGYFKRFAVFAAQIVLGQDDAVGPALGSEELHVDAVGAYCWRELEMEVKERWRCEGGRYFVLRGGGRREVPVTLGDEEGVRKGVVEIVEEFYGTLVQELPCLDGAVQRLEGAMYWGWTL